jgi:hypothetical protein
MELERSIYVPIQAVKSVLVDYLLNNENIDDECYQSVIVRHSTRQDTKRSPMIDEHLYSRE